MTWSFRIGRLFGSELRVHATFFLLLAWIGVGAWLDQGWPAAVENLAFIVALFACVVAHEFGHALMARRYGIRTPDITLLPIGGLARLERMPEKPAQEIAVALAGPAVNVAIWLVLALGMGAVGSSQALANIDDPAAGFFARLASVNLFLVLFNMIPAFPMDGGRVFRAALALSMGRARATRIAAQAGQIIAFGLGFAGLTSGNPVLLLIGIFVFVAAAAESAEVAMRDVAATLHVRSAMITEFQRLAPGDTVELAGGTLIRTTQAEIPIVDDTGRMVGLVTRAAILQAMHDGHPHAPLDRIMAREIPALPLTAPLTKAIDALYVQGAPAVSATDKAGLLLGYVTRENIGELMALKAH